MALSEKEVRHIAHLARLALNSQETKQFTQELSSILDYVSALNAVETKNVAPTSQVTGLVNVMRADRAVPFGKEKDLIAQAPEHQGGCIKTQAILE